MKKILIAFVIAISLASCTTGTKITTGTLLEEMINRNTMSEFPTDEYSSKQFSSYDRNSVSADSLGWFANADRSHFIRIEENSGRREFVMVDTDGPGAIVRVWITVASYEGNGVLRFYIDGSDTPVLEGEVLKMMSGGGIVDAPLAESVSNLTDYDKRGHNLYFPIAYSKHIKITYESPNVTEKPGAERGEAFYYNINYRSYTGNVSVKSFSKEDLVTYTLELKEAQEGLSTENREVVHGDEKSVKKDVSLKQNQSVAQSISGQKAIKRLSVKLQAKNLEQALRSTVLEIKFDGQQTV